MDNVVLTISVSAYNVEKYRLYTICNMNEKRLTNIKDFDLYLKDNNLYKKDYFDI